MPKKTSLNNFEKKINEIKSIVNKMEANDLSLEDSIKHYERGMTLSKQCQQVLNEAEQKIQVYMQEAKQAVPYDDKNKD